MEINMNSLPMMSVLPNGRAVIIDQMSDRQITETYCMIQEAAQNSEGYGIDEFDSEEDFRREIDGSDCFAIISKENGDMIAAFIITVSKFYRGPSGVADPFVIVKRSERQQRLGEFTMRKAIEFARSLGFMAMYVDTFSNNLALKRIMEKIGGFSRVGFLPMGGRLSNGEMVGSLIYYMNLTKSPVNLT